MPFARVDGERVEMDMETRRDGSEEEGNVECGNDGSEGGTSKWEVRIVLSC